MYMYQLSVASGVTGLCVVVAVGGTCFGQAVARLFSSSFFSFFSAILCAGRAGGERLYLFRSCNAHLNSSTLRVLRGRAACFGQVFSSAHNFPGRDRPARRTAATSFNVSFTHTYISSLNAFFFTFYVRFPVAFSQLITRSQQPASPSIRTPFASSSREAVVRGRHNPQPNFIGHGLHAPCTLPFPENFLH